MSKASIPPSAPDPVRRALPYKDFLQPALHRRFTSTAAVLLATSYVLSLSVSSWSSWLWAWIPFSSAGFRAYTIFFCGLIVIILRIAQYHIGIRTSTSPFETFLYNAPKPKTAETLFSYCLSGWFYGQIFRWSAPESAQLSWILHISGDRTRLNERPLFLVVHLVVVGTLHAVLHLFYDSDRLLLGTARPTSGSSNSSSSTTNTPSHGRTSQLYRQLVLRLPLLAISAFTRALASLFISVPVYMLFLRAPAWRLTLSLFRPFYSLPKSSLPPMATPFGSTLDFVPRCMFAGFLFSVLLLVSNTAFSLFLVNEPLKDGRPLTSESRDPNGSLLNGLRSKKPNVKAFALWELAFIARDFADRRVAIYTDIDRKNGPAWSQICKVCLDVVASLEARVDPRQQATKEAGSEPRQAQQQPTADEDAAALQRLARPIHKDTGILVTTPTKKNKFQSEVEKMVVKVAIDPESPPRLSPLAQKALGGARRRLESVQRDMSRPGNGGSAVQQLARRVLTLPVVGWPFRLTFRNRITAAVLGGPYGEPSIYVNAISALSLLAVHSLQEDKFGNVQRDVATVVRALTSATTRLDAFRATFPVHWTDVLAERSCPEVDDIRAALKDGLTDLLASFGQYSRDLRLSRTDIRLAEEAASAGRPRKAEETDKAEKSDKTEKKMQVR